MFQATKCRSFAGWKGFFVRVACFCGIGSLIVIVDGVSCRMPREVVASSNLLCGCVEPAPGGRVLAFMA
jgi:hypothetical protein